MTLLWACTKKMSEFKKMCDDKFYESFFLKYSYEVNLLLLIILINFFKNNTLNARAIDHVYFPKSIHLTSSKICSFLNKPTYLFSFFFTSLLMNYFHV